MLTPKRAKILEIIARWNRLFGYGPTVRYIALVLGGLSSATIQEHINRLTKDGYLTKRERGRHPRNYVLTDKAREVLK